MGEPTGTKAKLLDEAERLFAAGGIWSVTNREITEAAGQRNTSALNYHFGSRAELLTAVLQRRGDALDVLRGQHLAALGPSPAPRDLIRVLVAAYASSLQTQNGRRYVQIVDQFRNALANWREGASANDTNLTTVLEQLEKVPSDQPWAVREQRLVALMTLMTAMVSMRARLIEREASGELGHDEFVDELTDMLCGVLTHTS